MFVQLIARPEFIELPEQLGTPRHDQLQGPAAQKIVETAARTCYDSFGKGRSSNEHAQHILDVGHGSVLEHVQYTFFITGVSRGLTHELVRHRVGVAISQRSTRYVDESSSPWIMHPILVDYLKRTEDGDLRRRWSEAVQGCQIVYREIVEKLQCDLTERGVDALTARKQARGAARGILGNALETELVWSANVRTLRHVIEMRASSAADAEIRGLGCWLLSIMTRELPVYFKDYEMIDAPDGLGECAVTNHRKV